MNKKRTFYKYILRRFIFPSLGFLLGLYIKLVAKTSRIEVITDPEAGKYVDGLDPAIYAFWHGRLLMMAVIHPYDYHMHVLVSKNEIGILADYCMRQFGIKFIRGSSRNPSKPDLDKGGSEAFKQMLDTLDRGFPVGITPDGPLGPVHKVNKGAIMASMYSQKPIIPLSYASKRGYHAKSWDRFLIPYPFTKLVFKIGKPIQVPDDGDVVEYSKQLEAVLNQDMQELDQKVRS